MADMLDDLGLKSAPIAAMTANVLPRDSEETLKAGMNSHWQAIQAR
jgi:CheY-like chemotaxis protein